MITHKSVSQEVQWINRWELITLIDVLTTGKGIPCLRIDVVSLGTSFPPPPPPPLITKGRSPATIHGASII